MPRYCAVKVCRNRGGSASKQDNKRISFYPFPLQDKPRLQKWVDNMRREEWTPSRHQYLCSEHFTENCFDIRWGIRYLKNTAIPTVFHSAEDDGENVPSIKRSPKAKSRTFDIEPTGSDTPLSKRPLILSRTCRKFRSSAACHIVAEQTGRTDPIQVFELPVVSDPSTLCQPDLSNVQTAASETPANRGTPAACLALSSQDELHPEEQAVTVLCGESLNTFSDAEENVGAAALKPDQGLAFSFVPVENDMGENASHFWGAREPHEGEHISVYEHSYCRLDTDKDQLWSKILSLHAKILELDHREESTVGKIRALETEISLLKRDSTDYKEKQKVFEDYISSMLL